MNQSSSDRPPPGRIRGAWSSGAFLTLVAAGLLAFAPVLEAQDTGTITGTVTSARSGQPLSSVQVFLPETDRGTLTSAEGRFNIPNLAPGEYQLQAQRLGYRDATETVTVSAGETTTLDLAMSSQALRLDDIVVTGTAGQARQREVGNAITQINMGEVRDVVPSVDQLLQGRSPGLGVSQATGSVGSAAQIRLRGAVIGLTVQPAHHLHRWGQGAK